MTTRARRVNQLHREAMEFADESFVARLEKDHERYLHFTRLALEKEAAAADLMVDKDIEPTRSVLHRSAATLAWRCKEYDRGKKLAYRALAGNPPSDIERELHDLLSTIRLEEAGIRLGKEQLQFSLNGGAVGYGKAAIAELTTRMPSIKDMVQITARSIYRRLNNVVIDVDAFADIPMYVDGIAPGSFIVSLRLGIPVQSELPGFERFETVIEPFLDNLNLVDKGEFYELQKKLDDASDYLEFVKAAKMLAPDGKRVDSVKFQASIQDKLKVISFNQRQSYLDDFPLPEMTPQQDSFDGYRVTETDIRKAGVLKLADGLDKTKCVLVTDDNAKWDIEGPEDILDDIVRTHFKRRVEVSGKRMRKRNIVDRIWLDSRESVVNLDEAKYMTSSSSAAQTLIF